MNRSIALHDIKGLASTFETGEADTMLDELREKSAALGLDPDQIELDSLRRIVRSPHLWQGKGFVLQRLWCDFQDAMATAKAKIRAKAGLRQRDEFDFDF